MRFTAGFWLDEDANFGFEGTGFVLKKEGNVFNAGSNFAGNPPLFVPFFNVLTGQEGAWLADPLAGSTAPSRSPPSVSCGVRCEHVFSAPLWRSVLR